MANPNNNGTLVGRVSQDKQVFTNSDGSKVILATIAVDDNFRSGSDRKVATQFVPVRAFIQKSVDGIGSWDRVGKGDLISLSTRIACTPYEKDGKTVYPAPSIEVDGYPQFLEAKSVTEARAARNAVAETPAEESQEAQIARLQAELEAAKVGADTTPFANAA